MEGKRIGIVVGGAGAIPEAAIRMAQEHDVELVRVEDIKQEEFPEAYLIYMDIITADYNEKNDDAKKPASNLCDTIENIRATLKPDLKEALKNAKEEE